MKPTLDFHFPYVAMVDAGSKVFHRFDDNRRPSEQRAVCGQKWRFHIDRRSLNDTMRHCERCWRGGT